MLGAQSYPFETRRQERDEHGQVMMSHLAKLRQSASSFLAQIPKSRWEFDNCPAVLGMPGDYLELFWTLLGVKNLEQLKRSIPDDFDWSVLHPINKNTILIHALDLQYQGEDNLNLIEWLVRAGADFSQKCGSPGFTRRLWKSNDESTKISIDSQKHSFLSYISAWREQFERNDVWKKDLLFLDQVVDRVAKASSQRQSTRCRVIVDEGILENWEEFLHATESHDLTIEAADGHVTAHAQMLKQASPVFRPCWDRP